ncbi:MAG: hypothetical protein P8125_05725 [Gemmatimonadota bacterium]|jgi:hypothetical protein
MIAQWIVSGFGVIVLLFGAAIVVRPRSLPAFADLFLTPSGFWIAVGLRLLIGVLMWSVAGSSRSPAALRLLGGLMVVSAFVLPVIGLDGMIAVAEWGTGLSRWVLRNVGLLAALLGAFITWAVSPRRSEG